MIAYFDTSAIIKFSLDEPGIDEVDRLWREADIVFSSRIAYAEARAGLARAVRSGRSHPSEHKAARRGLDTRWDEVECIEITDPLVRLAGDLADRRGLRGYDSVHLASALVLGDEVVLASWDRELNEAASAEGLHVLTH